jgi:hypothetical protein
MFYFKNNGYPFTTISYNDPLMIRYKNQKRYNEEQRRRVYNNILHDPIKDRYPIMTQEFMQKFMNLPHITTTFDDIHYTDTKNECNKISNKTKNKLRAKKNIDRIENTYFWNTIPYTKTFSKYFPRQKKQTIFEYNFIPKYGYIPYKNNPKKTKRPKRPKRPKKRSKRTKFKSKKKSS